MAEREAQALRFYREHRHDDQIAFYRGRAEEYERAYGQAQVLSMAALVSAGVAGVLGAVDVWGLREWWGLAAVVLAGTATLLTAYSTMIGYERIGELYRETRFALHEACAAVPEPGEPLAEYVDAVEQILQQEHGQWGQLLTAPQPQAAPGAPGGPGAPQ